MQSGFDMLRNILIGIADDDFRAHSSSERPTGRVGEDKDLSAVLVSSRT